MKIDKGKAFGDLASERHARDLKHVQEYRDTKAGELAKIKELREKTHAEYMAMADLQALINEANQYKDEIEQMHVQHQHLSIKIEELKLGTEYLQREKDSLDEQKKETDLKNEENEKGLKGKEEGNQKRLLTKLLRDKTPEIKELIQRQDAQAESNEDFNNKYLKEREKMDQLLDENLQLKEKLRLTQEKFDKTKEAIAT
mmetsp:Transcript_40647/g.61967  ORF Transcript_40647/g.61967 Transcript_40647/m.61967 type:complete len:200 (-) Transcript_40647:374-973(-)